MENDIYIFLFVEDIKMENCGYAGVNLLNASDETAWGYGYDS